jgi:thioredoxin reductase
MNEPEQSENRARKVYKVSILGGGISGVTTGIVLQMHGFSTTIYTDLRLDEIPHDVSDIQRRPPEIASIHAAASVLPHSAVVDGIQELTKISITSYLREQKNCLYMRVK